MIGVVAWWFVRRGRDPASVAPATIGRFGEWIARRHYRRHRYRILAWNRRIAGVEIDILVRAPGSGAIVLVEVKSSTTASSGLRRLDRRRLRRMVRAATRLQGIGPLELHAVDVDLSGGRPLVRGTVVTPHARPEFGLSGRGISLRRS